MCELSYSYYYDSKKALFQLQPFLSTHIIREKSCGS